MATFTDNFALAKPTYGELADVAVINGNMDTIDGIMHSNRTMLAPAFSQTEDYAVGDVVVYEGNLYRFIVPHTAGNWDGTEVEQTTLGEEISTKGGADVTKTASGNPITFDDGADAPLVKCTTEIQGSQDLHGYDKPWVGGSGKNLLSSNRTWLIAENVSGTWTGDTYVRNGVTFEVEYNNTGYPIKITANGTNTSTGSFVFVTARYPFTLDTNYSINGLNNGSMSTGRINVQGVDNYIDGDNLITGDGETHRIGLQISGSATVNNVVWYPMLRYATVTDPTFAPYSNICPITAYTQGEIEVRGKNLFDKDDSDISTGRALNAQTGASYPATNWSVSNFIKIESSTTYTLNAMPSGSSSVAFYDSEKEYISGEGSFETKTTPSNAVYVRFDYKTEYANIMQLEKGSTATTYEPYTSTTHTTAYPSAIYRGSEDCVEGEVTTEIVGENIQDLTWAVRYTGSINKTLSTNLTYDYDSSNRDFIAEELSYIQNVGGASNLSDPDSKSIGIYGYGALQVTKVFYLVVPIDYTPNGKIVYSLATPTTSSVTPTNLPIKSLSGYTHIESSTGDMEVEYITQEFQPLVDLIEIGNGHTYSTSEQIVGKWTNGKDVYEKTIYYATLSCDRNDWAQLEALDAETFISYSATAHMETASGRQIDNNYIRISYYNGYLYHHEPEFGTGMVDLYVTVRYTKPSSNTRSLNLTKSAVEEIPDEIKNAPFEEKPDVNEADDDAPTEVDER